MTIIHSFIQQIFEGLQWPAAEDTVINKIDEIPVLMEFGREDNKKKKHTKRYKLIPNFQLIDNHLPTWIGNKKEKDL